MTNFICILGTRILRSTIKRYVPIGENKLNVYYNTSRNKPESETFVFNDSIERDDFVEYLDSIL